MTVPRLTDLAAELLDRQASEASLSSFTRRVMPGWIGGEWCDKITVALEAFAWAVEAGQRPRMILAAPPQHGKSSLVSRSFPAWLLGRWPGWPVVIASYAAALAAGHGRYVRNLLADPAYRAVFPATTLADDSAAADHLSTTSGGQLRCVGVGGGLSGHPARVLIVDDPIADRQAADSEVVRESTWGWYQSVASTRLWPGGGILIMATRWHLDDLTGRLLEAAKGSPKADQWQVLSFPAISDGRALHPERWPLEELEAKRASMPADEWSALYQQDPVPPGGVVFKREWWRYYDTEPDSGSVHETVQSWDTAFQAKADSDMSACVTAKVTDTGIYIVDCVTGRWEFPELKRMAVSLADRWRPSAVLIEDKASGQSLVQEMQRETRLPVLACKPEGDKVTRARRITAMVESGRVFLPRGAPWLSEWLDHFTTFPTGKIKDTVDSFTQLVQYLQFEEHVPIPVRNTDLLSGGVFQPFKQSSVDLDAGLDSAFVEQPGQSYWESVRHGGI